MDFVFQKLSMTRCLTEQYPKNLLSPYHKYNKTANCAAEVFVFYGALYSDQNGNDKPAKRTKTVFMHGIPIKSLQQAGIVPSLTHGFLVQVTPRKADSCQVI